MSQLKQGNSFMLPKFELYNGYHFLYEHVALQSEITSYIILHILGVFR